MPRDRVIVALVRNVAFSVVRHISRSSTARTPEKRSEVYHRGVALCKWQVNADVRDWRPTFVPTPT